MVLEKTLERSLDCKEIQPVHPKGDQSWGVHWKDWCWSWNSNTLATWCKELTHLKRPWCWERLRAGGEGDDRGWDGWMASPTRWTWVWVDSGSWWWTGRPGVLWSWGCKESDMTEWLKWTELKNNTLLLLSHQVRSDSFATPWTVACQAPLSMVFPRQEYWSGLPFPSPGDLAKPGIEPASHASSALAERFFTTEPSGKPSNDVLR